MREILTLGALLVTTSCANQAVQSTAQKSSSDELIRADLVPVDQFILDPREAPEDNPYGSQFEAQRQQDVEIPKVGTVAAFSFIGRNFIPDQKVTLASQSLYGAIKPLYEYQADDDGFLGRQIPEGTMMLENDVWLMFDFYKGQPVRYWLYTKDGKVRISTLFIPYPIETQARDGAKISIRRLTPDARLVICEGVDFLPDERLFITTQAAGQMVANTPIACANGSFSMVLEPGASGKTGGKALVEVKRANERLVLDYDWGCEAINPKKRLAPAKYMEQDVLSKLSQESAGQPK